MQSISLPISKSIANRLLILKAMRGDDLAFYATDTNTPNDVRLLHKILVETQNLVHENEDCKQVNIDNCGTAMRFLTAYFAQKEGYKIILDGSERMRKRPIGQLVEALTTAEADIKYLGEEGYPPIMICGKALQRKPLTINNPLSSQFVSALMLVGFPVVTNCRSPYIEMTRQMVSMTNAGVAPAMERDWSSAAFWYEYIALHGGELLLQDLSLKSMQGDKEVAHIFGKLGVESRQTEQGVIITKSGTPTHALTVDFSPFPDLYPAVYATCNCLHIETHFTGLELLPLKESNRLEAMRQMEQMEESKVYSSCNDHRIAMALICADLRVDNTECISKSYPQFIEQWQALHQ